MSLRLLLRRRTLSPSAIDCFPPPAPPACMSPRLLMRCRHRLVPISPPWQSVLRCCTRGAPLHALAYREKKDDERNLCSLGDGDPGQVEVLLISMPNRINMVCPKGGWEDDEDIYKAACCEAMEEAGVKGIIDRKVVKQLVKEMDTRNMIICYNLKKVYCGKNGNTDKLAVRGLSLALHKGQCFGMLGPNGAGKTSFINMMIGLVAPTYGTAYIHGMDLRKDMNGIYANIGVCPPHDLLGNSDRKRTSNVIWPNEESHR